VAVATASAVKDQGASRGISVRVDAAVATLPAVVIDGAGEAELEASACSTNCSHQPLHACPKWSDQVGSGEFFSAMDAQPWQSQL
jgi:hypothetical protein